MTERFWLRSYNHELDREDWVDEIDIHEATRRQLEAQRKGYTTRIYTEAEMRERGWVDHG